MTHTPAHCPKCIINGGFVAPAADLYHQLTLSEAAERLSAAATTANETFMHAITVGVLSAPDVDGWKGCDEAAEIMSWVGKQLNDSANADEEPRRARDEKMNGWTCMFAAVAHGVVTDKPHQHEHSGHTHDEDDALIGG